jgi:hypothetical protein
MPIEYMLRVMRDPKVWGPTARQAGFGCCRLPPCTAPSSPCR